MKIRSILILALALHLLACDGSSADAKQPPAPLDPFAVKYGSKPTQSSWDGSYRTVTKYLERIAKDPDSVEINGCTKVIKGTDGWRVGCDYRAKNGFGALVRNSSWFTIAQGRVIRHSDK